MATRNEILGELARRGAIRQPAATQQPQASRPSQEEIAAELERRRVGALPPQEPTAVEAAASNVGLEDFDAKRFLIESSDPDILPESRSLFLPTGTSRETGETVFAVPLLAFGVGALALDAATSLLTFAGVPGEVAAGRSFEPKDATEFAFNFGVPGLRTSGATKSLAKFSKLTKKQVADAPDTKGLIKEASKLFDNYKKTESKLSSDDFFAFLAKTEDDLVKDGADPKLHATLFDVFNTLTNRSGKDLGAQELFNMRRIIGNALDSGKKDEVRLARTLQNNFDDFVQTLPGNETWVKARRLYTQAIKSEKIDDALVRASRQASGIENGIRIELKNILNSKKRSRGFTDAEKKVMQGIVDGDFTANTLKRLGKLGFGTGKQTNVLGGTAGGGIGAAAGAAFGPGAAAVGAIAIPAIGNAAQRILQKRATDAAKALQALIAGASPKKRARLTDVQRVPRAALGVTAATQLEDEQ